MTCFFVDAKRRIHDSRRIMYLIFDWVLNPKFCNFDANLLLVQFLFASMTWFDRRHHKIRYLFASTRTRPHGEFRQLNIYDFYACVTYLVYRHAPHQNTTCRQCRMCTLRFIGCRYCIGGLSIWLAWPVNKESILTKIRMFSKKQNWYFLTSSI